MTVAVMQPTYLGWCGYFAMVAAVDCFVLLDTVAVSRQSWQTRNRVRQPDGRTVWLSIPVRSFLGEALAHVEIDDSRDWKRKHLRTIEACYARAPYWHELAWLDDSYGIEYERLADFTSHLIPRIANQLGISTRIIRASELDGIPDGKTERLAAILEQFDADVYLTTPGATYLHGQTRIGPARIQWHDYTPRPYEQGGLPWDGQLAILDALAWNGAVTTRELICV